MLPGSAGTLAVRFVEDGVHERLGSNGARSSGPLTEPDELDREAQLPLHGHRRCRPWPSRLSLVRTSPVTPTASVNWRAWVQAVLAGGRVEHEQHLTDLAALALQDAADLPRAPP